MALQMGGRLDRGDSDTIQFPNGPTPQQVAEARVEPLPPYEGRVEWKITDGRGYLRLDSTGDWWATAVPLFPDEPSARAALARAQEREGVYPRPDCPVSVLFDRGEDRDNLVDIEIDALTPKDRRYVWVHRFDCDSCRLASVKRGVPKAAPAVTPGGGYDPNEQSVLALKNFLASIGEQNIAFPVGRAIGIIKQQAAELAALREKAEAGAKFKAFVHSYLTQHGVPEGDPENQKQKEGCRIGARLDLLFAERKALSTAVKVFHDYCITERGWKCPWCRHGGENGFHYDDCTMFAAVKAAAALLAKEADRG